MWNRLCPLAPGKDAIVLDTEGLASAERTTNVDTKIFSLAILLSSIFVFNQIGPINENALEELALVLKVAKTVRVRADGPEDAECKELATLFPQFHWVLRDFFHRLDGRTPREYMEDALREVPGLSEEVYKKNKIREAIKHFFTDRNCTILIRPITDESKLAHVEDLPYEELKPEFRK